MMGGAATTAAGMAQVSPELVIKAMRELELLPRPPWTLIAPDGRAWMSSDPAELLKVLLPHHPLLRPLGLGHG